jgi:hypothetical protein
LSFIQNEEAILLFSTVGFPFSAAGVLRFAFISSSIFLPTAMELDENAKQAVRELGDAINSAIEKSERVMEAIEYLREIGYEPNLSLKLEIGLLEIERDGSMDAPDIGLKLTDEDMRTLRSMKIRIDN